MIELTYRITCDKCGSSVEQKFGRLYFPTCPLPVPQVRQVHELDICDKCFDELTEKVRERIGWSAKDPTSKEKKH